jgi:hypothetical protein
MNRGFEELEAMLRFIFSLARAFDSNWREEGVDCSANWRYALTFKNKKGNEGLSLSVVTFVSGATDNCRERLCH